MKVEIDGHAVAPRALGLREPGYGGASATDPLVSYVLWLPLEQVVETFAGYYQDYVEDARRFRDEGNAVEAALARLGWPSFVQLAKEHPTSLGMFLLEVAYDLLVQVLGSEAPSRHRYFVNGVEDVTVQDGSVRLSGPALHYGG